MFDPSEHHKWDISKPGYIHPKLSAWLNATRGKWVFLWSGWTDSLMAFSLSVPETAPCGGIMWCNKTTNTSHMYVVKLLWAGILIKRKEKPQSAPRIQRNTTYGLCLLSIFNSFPSFPSCLFFSFSLCRERTQILITWWDYILCPCVCNRACGFSYNLHEPL